MGMGSSGMGRVLFAAIIAGLCVLRCEFFFRSHAPREERYTPRGETVARKSKVARQRHCVLHGVRQTISAIERKHT